MSDWLTIRVVLEGSDSAELDEPPGRIFLAHTDHSLADLAEAIDVAFGRWDLAHLHEFTVEARTLVAGGGDEGDQEDSDDVTLGELGLLGGEHFSYVFDLGEWWRHACTIEEVNIDPEVEYGEEPDGPVPVFGWGSIPDQYWRVREEEEAGESEWQGPEAWAVAERVLGEVAAFDADPDALQAVTDKLRAHEGDRGWPYGALLAAAALDATELPDDDAALWVEVAAGVINPAENLPVAQAEEHAWTAIEPADWVAIVIELSRAEQPAPDAPALLELIARCPEVEEQDLAPDDEHTLLRGLDLARRLLETLGALDAEGRLTPLGRWGLPQALRQALASE